MTRQLTALALALVMASPLCCCNWMRHQTPAAVERSCCKAKSNGVNHGSPKSEDCRCAQTPKVRALVSGSVQVPEAAFAGDMKLLLPQAFELLKPSAEVAILSHLANEHAPPRWPVPLYQQYCSLRC